MLLTETSRSSSPLDEGNSFLVRKLSHYRNLPADELLPLEGSLQRSRRTTQPRAILIEQGEPAGEICVILDGWAARQKVLADGSRQILAFHLPGDICEFNALLGAAADTETIALNGVKSARITRRLLNELAVAAPRVSQALWWEALSSNAIQREWLINIARRSATERIAHLLCELHSRLLLVGLASSTGFQLPLTQAQLANACAMTVEHTNRTLRKLRDLAGVQFEAGSVDFADPEAVRSIARFNGDYLLLKEMRSEASSTPFLGAS